MNSKWLGIALIASLVINLLLAGFVLGRMSQGPLAMGPDPIMAFPRFAGELSEQRRHEMRPHLKAHLSAMRPNRRALHNARQMINEAIVAEPFEADRLEQALRNMYATQNQLSESAQKSFVHFISSLTPAERAQYVKRTKPRRPLHQLKRPLKNKDSNI